MVDVKKAVAVAIILMVMVIAGFTLFDNSSELKSTDKIKKEIWSDLYNLQENILSETVEVVEEWGEGINEVEVEAASDNDRKGNQLTAESEIKSEKPKKVAPDDIS